MRRAIVTVCIGDEFRDIAAITHPSLERYARACEAQLLVWREVSARCRHPHFRIFDIGELFNQYERVLLIDSDVWIRPGAPDLFALVSPDHVGMCDEAPFNRERAERRMHAAIRFNNRVLRERGLSTYDGGWRGHYYNGGVIVASASHRAVFEMPLYDVAQQGWDGRPVAESSIANQPYLNFRLLQLGLTPTDVGYRFNCPNPFSRANDRTVAHVRRCFFFHATGKTSTKIEVLRRVLPQLRRPLAVGDDGFSWR